MELDSIYFNATNKLRKINERIANGTQFHQSSIGDSILKYIEERTLFVPKGKKIGIYKPLILGNKGDCFYCEAKTHTDKDHFFPKSKGGILIVHSCIECNRAKSNLIPTKWIEKVEQTKRYSASKKQIIIFNTKNLLDEIISSGLERPFHI